MTVRTAYVAFEAATSPPITVAGKLNLPGTPDGKGGAGPAVVICHGSDGVDGRGDYYAPTLNAQGVATLEIDMWAARGVTRGAAARPRSPVETLPDAFAALAFLAAQPEVDPRRIGIMGFSWGGVVTLLCSARRYANALAGAYPQFAAHAAFYPVCWAYSAVPALALTDPTAAPILIQTGGADAYDGPGAGEALANSLKSAGANVEAICYPGATHGFDRDLPPQTINDPFAHQGAGGPVLMAYDAVAAPAAREAVVGFFERALAAKGP